MARLPSPAKHHRPKDLCTIEQAEHIAGLVAEYHVKRHIALERHRRWHRRLWRTITKPFTRTRV